MKIQIPGPDVPLVLPSGLVNPVWYEKLKLVFEKRKLVDLADIDVTSIANGKVAAYNSTTTNFEFVDNLV